MISVGEKLTRSGDSVNHLQKSVPVQFEVEHLDVRPGVKTNRAST